MKRISPHTLMLETHSMPLEEIPVWAYQKGAEAPEVLEIIRSTTLSRIDELIRKDPGRTRLKLADQLGETDRAIRTLIEQGPGSEIDLISTSGRIAASRRGTTETSSTGLLLCRLGKQEASQVMLLTHEGIEAIDQLLQTNIAAQRKAAEFHLQLQMKAASEGSPSGGKLETTKWNIRPGIWLGMCLVAAMIWIALPWRELGFWMSTAASLVVLAIAGRATQGHDRSESAVILAFSWIAVASNIILLFALILNLEGLIGLSQATAAASTVTSIWMIATRKIRRHQDRLDLDKQPPCRSKPDRSDTPTTPREELESPEEIRARVLQESIERDRAELELLLPLLEGEQAELARANIERSRRKERRQKQEHNYRAEEINRCLDATLRELERL